MAYMQAQQDTLPHLLTHIRMIVTGSDAVEGHRNVPGVKKACPSFDVAHWQKTGEFRL